ncbi:MAG: nickel-dependent hydrogenase large subunit [Persephonella sp.]|nr:nickel-dependent hydrogenase large subunit [Persephonella sp.]
MRTLQQEEEYPILKGKIISNKGLEVTKEEFKELFTEFQVEHSTAKKCRIKGKEIYVVGAVSRFNNSFEKLSQTALAETMLKKPRHRIHHVRNSFKTLLVRMVEIIHSLEKSVYLIKNYRKPPESPKITVKKSSGTGVSEAPRGVLWHRYSFDEEGRVLEADIVPPTSQNQDIMEENVKSYLKRLKRTEIDYLTLEAEKIIRNYDPCISCATHFLKVDKSVKSCKIL